MVRIRSPSTRRKCTHPQLIVRGTFLENAKGGEPTMTPERKHKIRGRLVEEFYWCGRYPCYVDHRLCAEDFDATVARMKGRPQVGIELVQFSLDRIDLVQRC